MLLCRLFVACESSIVKRLLSRLLADFAMLSSLLGLLIGLAGFSAPTLAAPEEPAAKAQREKVLRYSFRVAETGFDPAQISDLYSRTVASAIFDAPLHWDYLARPYRYRVNTLSELPTVSPDYKTFIFKIKPGIYFSDAPEFKGAKRELVAADYVYSWKRHYDPKWKSPNLYILENFKILGLSELRKELMAAKKPFDYEREVEGLKVLDKYTLQIKTAEPMPRLVDQFTDGSTWGAVAREVIEAHGLKAMEHPVGTGPYMLGQWRRSSKIELVRNPNYREVYYDEEPPAGDTLAQATAARLKGKRLPMVDRIEIAIIEENQPRWMAFLNGEHDFLDQLPAEFASIAIPRNEVAPNLQKKGIQMSRYPRADVAMTYFNMDDPVIGGYEPERIALRRAMSLAVDVDREIRLLRKGQAIAAQGSIAPSTWGYVADFKTEMSDFDPARAKALLDMFGYVDRNGDGWRERPDGSPLLLNLASQADQESRNLAEQWKLNLKRIGIKLNVIPAKWPENLKAANAGKLQMWGVGWLAGLPDGDTFLALGDGKSKGQANKSRFDLPEFNRLYALQKTLPNGPERQAAMTEAQRLMVAYAPYKFHAHRITTDMFQPWVIGYHRNPFLRENWRWLDVDLDKRMQVLGR